MSWLDRALTAVAPARQLKRLRARAAVEMFTRNYDAAKDSRRTSGWRRIVSDANTAIGPSLSKLRDAARDLVRNNAYAESALSTIVDHAVGWGIVPTAKHKAFTAWANSTDCDADGQHDFAGLQKLVMRTVVESGEVIVRRRWRRVEDGFALPMQLQVLEPDYLDTSKDGPLPGGKRVIQGVQIDSVGYREGYWIFRNHPGSSTRPGGSIISGSYFVRAEDVLLISKISRPGQVRAVTWFAPVLLMMKDFEEFTDATLMKQKVSACLALVVTDPDGAATPVGTAGTTTATENFDTIEPGAILNRPFGSTVTTIDPPAVREFADYTKTVLHAIAAGLGVTYEDLTGNYENLPFSAARMSRIRHWARVEDWRYRMLIPQFLNPVWQWAMEAAAQVGIPTVENTGWTPPGMPMIEPDKEGLAAQRNIRTGISSLFDEIRQRGFDPETYLLEIKAGFDKLDELGLTLDCDPRKVSQQGQLHPVAPSKAKPAEPEAEDESDDEAA
jgi:lambda family phage portal protein